ncbi:DUF4350 domain-containing protein [Rufibacter sp. LB8]|uniref:DUF4350 domain-containing protein n=1 Tax=Rufibacter sp. LB8 TaxID=2777781 RepID=UPI00178C786D|nr:DUF4350 domain-containing protein [Rufibacter sp. LB8]
MKQYKTYALVLGLLFTVLVVVEYYRPKPIDWNVTFINKDKIPYGTNVLYQLLPELFKREAVSTVRQPILNQVETSLEDSAAQPVNYVFVNASFAADSLDVDALLDFVAQGNQAFISAYVFEKALRDTLHFSVASTTSIEQDSIGLVFTHPQLKNLKPARYAWARGNVELVPDAAAKATVLGKNTVGGVNFVQVPFGKGSFFLSSVPFAFSNYYVIKTPQSKYAAAALSHLPVQPVWWDEYQKQGSQENESKFRVLLSYDALTWAYYITLGGLFLFVLFQSKRTQRIIPVVEKPRNTTLEFVQVVGDLYYNYRDHKAIAEKKVNYFLEYLRLHFHEHTTDLDQELQERVAAKSGIDLQEITKLFNIIQDVRRYETVEEITLWNLNKKLENFYRNAGR